MGQEEVLKTLEREDKPLTVEEMQAIINLGRRAIYQALKQLLKHEEVKKLKGLPVRYFIKK